MKREFWNDSGREVEIYRSTFKAGSRHSMFERYSVYNVRPSIFGINGWKTAAEVRAFLASKGWNKNTEEA